MWSTRTKVYETLIRRYSTIKSTILESQVCNECIRRIHVNNNIRLVKTQNTIVYSELFHTI